MADSAILNKAKDFAVVIVSLYRSGYRSEAEYKPLQNDCGSIRRMLISSINTAKQNAWK